MITSTYIAARKGGLIMCCRPVSPVALKELISTKISFFLRHPDPFVCAMLLHGLCTLVRHRYLHLRGANGSCMQESFTIVKGDSGKFNFKKNANNSTYNEVNMIKKVNSLSSKVYTSHGEILKKNK